jgi:hypothetical protein
MQITKQLHGFFVLRNGAEERRIAVPIVDEGEDCLGACLDPDAQQPYETGHRYFTFQMGIEEVGDVCEVGVGNSGGVISRTKFEQPISVTEYETLELKMPFPAPEEDICVHPSTYNVSGAPRVTGRIKGTIRAAEGRAELEEGIFYEKETSRI